MSGNLSFGALATMQCNVVPASADNVDVSAVASLNGRLSVTMTGTFTPGTQFTLLHAGGGIAPNTTFSSISINYPTGQCFTPVIIYGANNVYLYLQPGT
jgi:hypothetical protein